MEEMSVFSKLCIQCNECCKWMTFVLEKKFVDEHEQFYRDRGCELFDQDDGKTTAVMIPTVCPKLQDNGMCKIYSTRSVACRKFDGRADPLTRDVCKWTKELPDVPYGTTYCEAVK